MLQYCDAFAPLHTLMQCRENEISSFNSSFSPRGDQDQCTTRSGDEEAFVQIHEKLMILTEHCKGSHNTGRLRSLEVQRGTQTTKSSLVSLICLDNPVVSRQKSCNGRTAGITKKLVQLTASKSEGRIEIGHMDSSTREPASKGAQSLTINVYLDGEQTDTRILRYFGRVIGGGAVSIWRSLCVCTLISSVSAAPTPLLYPREAAWTGQRTIWSAFIKVGSIPDRRPS